MRLKKHWKRPKHLKRFLIFKFWLTLMLTLVLYSFLYNLIYFSSMVYFYHIILLFSSFQLPARQEPTVDSSKYSAADVRIVSISTSFNLSDFSLFLLFFNSKGKKSKMKMTKVTSLQLNHAIFYYHSIERKARAMHFETCCIK